MELEEQIQIMKVAAYRIMEQVPGESEDPDTDIAIMQEIAFEALEAIGADPYAGSESV
jgi:hypothetical protein